MNSGIPGHVKKLFSVRLSIQKRKISPYAYKEVPSFHRSIQKSTDMMKTIVVATDFSSTALNAAQYAACLTRQIPVSKLILYHSYYDIISKNIGFTDTQFYLQSQEDSMRRLNNLKRELGPLAADGLIIECIASISPIKEVVHSGFLDEDPTLIVMGMTVKSKLEKKITGSQVLIAAQHTTKALLIIPSNATYKKIKKIVYAWDMGDSEKTFPKKMFKDIMSIFKAELWVLNIDYNNRNFNENTINEQALMHRILDPEAVKYIYGHHRDAGRGIIEFADQQHADWIIIIPKKKSFPDSLFRKSTTRSVAFQIKIPLLILPPCIVTENHQVG
jgi:nucleotide-binding universal stress UspA family protein